MKNALSGTHNRNSILITAGPTRERIDPVRFISNYSTGLFGYSIAREAVKRGLDTVLISGPVSLKPPAGAKVINVESAEEMRKAVLRELKDAHYVVMAAAVSDWKARFTSQSKIKKCSGIRAIKLTRNPDILEEIGRKKGKRVLIGFALETEDLEKNAYKKLKQKGADMIVANMLGKGRMAFGDNKTDIVMIDKYGKRKAVRNRSKAEQAKIVLDNIFSINI